MEELLELREWLCGEKYIIRQELDSMTPEYEDSHKWELSRNRMIDKTINKIDEMIKSD